jgi:serine/threonine protein kinase/tetratricopeptide (TPR) repeat protein
MSAGDRQRVRDVFQSAVSHAPEARAAYLDAACADDRELRQEVESLLSAHEEAGSFLSRPAALEMDGRSRTRTHPAADKLPNIPGFRLMSRLGEGGMGTVFLAEDEVLRRRVALKLISERFSSSPEGSARFLREARTMASVEHPHVVRVYSFGEHDGRPFLAMECVTGETLAQLLARNGPLPIERARAITHQVTQGLEAAWRLGVVHRDVKPSNILVDTAGHARVADFGLAKAVYESGGLTREGSAPGTPAYMSPEQARGERLDARSDIYSLGLVLYEMLTGRRPFEGATPYEVVERQLHDPLPALAEARPEAGPALATLVAAMTQKDRDRRPSSYAEVLRSLEDLASPRALRSAQPGIGRRWPLSILRRSPSETPGRPLWTLVTVVLAAAALWLTADRWNRSSASAHTILVWPMEFQGESTDPHYVGRSFSEALAVNLSQAAGLSVLPVPEVGELGRTGALGRAAQARRLGAGYLVTGGITRQGERLSVRVSLIESERNRIAWGADGRPVQSLAAGASQLAQELAARLGVASNEKRYDYFMYLTGPPEMARSPELLASLGAIRRFETAVGLEATGRLLARFPREADAHVLRAGALLLDGSDFPSGSAERNRLDEALAALDRVDPRNPWDDIFRGLLLTRDSRDSDAIEVFGKVLARSDLTPAARANVLILRSGAETSDAAASLRDMEEARRLEPANDITLSLASGVLRQLGRYQDALELARQAVALNPQPNQTQHILGLALASLGRWEEAVPAFAQSCADKTVQEYCADYAIALFHAGQGQEAERVAREAAARRETEWGTYNLARFWALAGRRDDALRLVAKAVALGVPPAAVGPEPEWDRLRGDPAFKRYLSPSGGPTPTPPTR